MSATAYVAPLPAPSDLELARAKRGEVVHAPTSPGGTAICSFSIFADDPRVARRVGENEWARAVTCGACLRLMEEYPRIGRRPLRA